MLDLTIFLDDGGVMNDNSIRGGEWQRMVGEFFAPRLGGSAGAWADANLKLVLLTQPWNEELLPGESYAAWYRRYQINWLKVMADRVGVALPDENQVLSLAEAAARHITLNCRSAFADAVPAIRDLAGAGFGLHTASGEDSCELNGYLTGMGVREAFTYLFGPDLVDAFKRGAIYYDRLFQYADVAPDRCLVVDDSAEALAWAAAAGAQTVFVRRGRSRPDGYEGLAVDDLGGLVPLIQSLGGG